MQDFATQCRKYQFSARKSFNVSTRNDTECYQTLAIMCFVLNRTLGRILWRKLNFGQSLMCWFLWLYFHACWYVCVSVCLCAGVVPWIHRSHSATQSRNERTTQTAADRRCWFTSQHYSSSWYCCWWYKQRTTVQNGLIYPPLII